MPRLPKLPRICVCIGQSDPARAATLALSSCDHGETFLELRIDILDDPVLGERIVRRIRRRHPDARILATCRRRVNGGRFRGSIQRQLAILEHAVAAGADLVDVEIETIEQAPGCLERFRESAPTLASYHNFERTPAMGPVRRRLERTGADLYKVATKVVRPSDNLKLLELCEAYSNIVVAGMGEAGSAARLVSPLRGGLFAFVSPDSYTRTSGKRTFKIQGPPTAPGQVPASQARQLFRVQLAKRDTKVFAVIAKPVGHSMSPQVQNRAFKSKRFNGMYIPWLVEPVQLRDFIRTARELPVAGVSVTIPHKQKVIRYLDGIDPAARGIGAVNTLYWKRGKLVGTNTDADGIALPLAKRVRLNRSRILVVGNGGAALAAVVALRDKGAKVFVTGRSPQRVRRLASLHGVSAVDFHTLGDQCFDVLVHSTPVGMAPDTRGNLFPRRIPADLVFDLVYNPAETALLRHAKQEGKAVIGGIEMFVEQAAAQFKVWTGLDAPREAMRRAVLNLQ